MPLASQTVVSPLLCERALLQWLPSRLELLLHDLERRLESQRVLAAPEAILRGGGGDRGEFYDPDDAFIDDGEVRAAFGCRKALCCASLDHPSIARFGNVLADVLRRRGGTRFRRRTLEGLPSAAESRAISLHCLRRNRRGLRVGGVSSSSARRSPQTHSTGSLGQASLARKQSASFSARDFRLPSASDASDSAASVEGKRAFDPRGWRTFRTRVCLPRKENRLVRVGTSAQSLQAAEKCVLGCHCSCGS